MYTDVHSGEDSLYLTLQSTHLASPRRVSNIFMASWTSGMFCFWAKQSFHGLLSFALRLFVVVRLLKLLVFLGYLLTSSN